MLPEYEKANKAKWPGICQYGKRQSPVALCKKLAYQVEMPPLSLKNFKEFRNASLENQGHTVKITFPKECVCNLPKICGGTLTQGYTLSNIHFHWPAEHTIEGVRYDLEAHFVFYADRYGSITEAATQPLGLTVMAIMYFETISTRCNVYRQIADAVKLVSHKPHTSTTISEAINLYHFLPYDHRTFYRYVGSLTTPPCGEFVNWVVMKNAANISYLDLKDLTNVYGPGGVPMGPNNRDVQDLHERITYLRRLP